MVVNMSKASIETLDRHIGLRVREHRQRNQLTIADVAQLAELSPPGTRTLLVTMEYDQSRMAGPPHSVPEAEVHELFGATHSIEWLARDSCLDDFPRFSQRGVDALAEAFYLLTRR